VFIGLNVPESSRNCEKSWTAKIDYQVRYIYIVVAVVVVVLITESPTSTSLRIVGTHDRPQGLYTSTGYTRWLLGNIWHWFPEQDAGGLTTV
jgi:hypothetical protein